MKVKVGIKPVFGVQSWSSLLHAIRPMAKEEFQRLSSGLEQNLTDEAEILDFAIIEKEEDLKKLEADLQDTDLYLACTGLGTKMAVAIGEMYSKPVARVGHGVSSLDLSAYLRSRNLEGYAPLSYYELNELISLMRVRKAIRLTKVLVVTYSKLPSFTALSSAWDLEDIEKRFKVGFKVVSTERFFMEVDGSKKAEAQKLADEMISSASEITVDREHVIKSAKQYLVLKSLMGEYGCNALTVNCIEPIYRRERITPCLALTLLNDEGIPASCEGDVSALLAMMMLMYTSKKSASMGNFWMESEAENLIRISHDIPGLKMEGLDKADSPYSLYDFHGTGWGTTIYREMKEGQDVTIARFNPLATKFLASRGTITGCYPNVSCRETTEIKVSDAKRLLHKAADYGNHFAFVYGDYSDFAEKLADLLDVEAEFA